jgi:DNA-binding CsgD family transcriptional regulator
MLYVSAMAMPAVSILWSAPPRPVAPEVAPVSIVVPASAPSARTHAADVFDRLAAPIFVVDAEGRVLDRNSAAAAHDDAFVRYAAVAAAIHAACTDTGCRPSFVHPARSTLSAVVVPSRGCAVVVVVDESSQSRTADPRPLQALFGLTAREAGLVSHLVQGCSVDEVCAQMGISMATARTHLRHAFAKTGTERQGELISMVLGKLMWLGAWTH